MADTSQLEQALKGCVYEVIRDAAPGERGLVIIFGTVCGGCTRTHHISEYKAKKVREELADTYQVEFKKGAIQVQVPISVRPYRLPSGEKVNMVTANYPLTGLIFRVNDEQERLDALGYARFKKAPLQELTEAQLQICRSAAKEFPRIYYKGKPF